MSNELDDNESDNERYNKMDNNLVDNNFVVNDNNHIETNVEAYDKQYEIGNYEENQRLETNNNMENYDIFKEGYESHQFSLENFDKLSFNKLMHLEDNDQAIDSEKNETTDETIAHDEENEENKVTTYGNKMTQKNIEESIVT